MKRASYENVWLARIASSCPDARAYLKGGPGYPQINGLVCFYQCNNGVLVVADVHGLPYTPGPCNARVYGFHIHQGDRCDGTPSDPFAEAKGHYNPDYCQHPQHAGDLPPLFGNDGSAWCAVLTNRFALREVIGRTVIIHALPDDLTSQPSGNSGQKIACGLIRRQ